MVLGIDGRREGGDKCERMADRSRCLHAEGIIHREINPANVNVEKVEKRVAEGKVFPY